MQDPSMDANGYAIVQASRPQTLAYGLTDSPVGQLAWIVAKCKEWTDPKPSCPRTPAPHAALTGVRRVSGRS